MRFWKTQTIGNDFILVHEQDAVTPLDQLAVALCERKFSIGSDGLLVVAPHEGNLRMRMFNPDGTEDFCGNGLRCAALHAFNQGWVQREHTIEHCGRLVSASVLPVGSVSTDIGPATYEPDKVPVASDAAWIGRPLHGFIGAALSTGSTHFVTFVDELPGDEAFNRVSPLIENDPLFPMRTSVIYVKESGERYLEIRIWERGVGETLGCGTGSSAAAAEWMRKNARSGQVEVMNPGGALIVSAEEVGGSLTTQSKPEVTFIGEIDRETLASLRASSR